MRSAANCTGRGAANGTTFAAQCYKGGSPWHSAKVILRRFGGNKISVRILNFPWVSSDPDRFERCKGSEDGIPRTA